MASDRSNEAAPQRLVAIATDSIARSYRDHYGSDLPNWVVRSMALRVTSNLLRNVMVLDDTHWTGIARIHEAVEEMR